MILNIDLSEKTVESFVENEAIVENVALYSDSSSTTDAVFSISANKTCQNFIAKTITILKLLARFKHFYWLQGAKTVDGLESFYMLTIMNTKDSSFIFDTFKKLGILINEIKIGYSERDKKIYLTNKLLRDLSKFSGDVTTQIFMYIISLAYFFINLTTKTSKESLKYEAFSDMLCMSKSFYEDIFKNSLFSFVGENVYTITEFTTKDLKTIINYQNIYSEMPVITTPYTGTYAFLESINDSGEKDVSVIYTQGVKSFNPLVLKISKNTIVSNTALNFIDLMNDSFISLICNFLGTTVKTTYTPYLGLKSEGKYYIYSDYEDLELDENQKNVVDNFEALSIENCLNIKDLESLLGVKLDVSKVTFTDLESIKHLYDDDSYAQQLYLQVQDYFETFDLKELSNCIKGFANGSIYSMIFTGESGTGKSTAAKVIPSRCGIPFVNINFSANIEESDLFGSMIPNAEKKTAEDPEFIWQDGIITRAIRDGYCVILEEINFARASVLGKLNSLLDESHQIDLPTGEIVKAHPNFRLIATCNIAYEGTNRFNKALINRFEVCCTFKDLSKEEVINVIVNRTGYSDRAKIEKIYAVYEAIKKYSREQNLRLVVSLRQLLTIFKQGKFYKNAKDAVTMLMLNGAFIEETEYKDVFEDTVLKAFDLSFKL